MKLQNVNSFHFRMRLIRLLLGLNQSEMAKHLGIRQSRYAKLELGQLDFKLEQLVKLKEKFGISLDEILDPKVDVRQILTRLENHFSEQESGP